MQENKHFSVLRKHLRLTPTVDEKVRLNNYYEILHSTLWIAITINETRRLSHEKGLKYM